MDDQRRDKPPDAPSVRGFIEKRKEPRYTLPAVYRRYITLRVSSDGAMLPAALGSFSRHGVMFEIASAFEVESRTDCLISIAESFSRDVAFSIRIKSCTKKDNVYIVGAVIEAVASEVWFEVFMEVHDFIVKREGVVY